MPNRTKTWREIKAGLSPQTPTTAKKIEKTQEVTQTMKKLCKNVECSDALHRQLPQT